MFIWTPDFCFEKLNTVVYCGRFRQFVVLVLVQLCVLIINTKFSFLLVFFTGDFQLFWHVSEENLALFTPPWWSGSWSYWLVCRITGTLSLEFSAQTNNETLRCFWWDQTLQMLLYCLHQVLIQTELSLTLITIMRRSWRCFLLTLTFLLCHTHQCLSSGFCSSSAP